MYFVLNIQVNNELVFTV